MLTNNPNNNNSQQKIFYRDRPLKLVDIKEDDLFEIVSHFYLLLKIR
jgi:hypothetical protein